MKIIQAGLITLLISFSSITIYGQQAYTLKGTARHMAGRKVELLDYFGDKNRVVGSTTVHKKGFFQFPFTDDSPVGMYQLRFEKGRSIDFIYNREDIELSINRPQVQAGSHSPLDNINILSSEENRLYYDYVQTLARKQNLTVLLNQLKKFYLPFNKEEPNRSTSGKPIAITISFYKLIEDELNNISQEFERYRQRFFNNNPHFYATKIIKTMRTPVLNIEVSEDGRKEWLKEHFWDSVDFADITLLQSPVIPLKVLEYISLFKDDRLSKEEQEMANIEAVDVILFKVREDETAFALVLDFVTRRFEESDFELVFTYITENYFLANSCKNNDVENIPNRTEELRDKVEKIKRLAIGKNAPGIRMPLEGIVDLKVLEELLIPAGRSELKLSDISAQYTLVLFWASWCPHCSSLMSAVKEVYDEYRDKGLEVLAISVDKDLSTWLNALSKGQYRWINYSELKGWDGKAANDYNVWSTPRMYLLDKEKRIVAKPVTAEELKESIAPLESVKTD